MFHCKKKCLPLILLISILMLLFVSSTCLAEVIPFRDPQTGDGQGSGGKGEVGPRGFSVVTDAGHFWLNSNYTNQYFNAFYTGTANGLDYVNPGTTQQLYAWIDKNPANCADFIVLYKDGVLVPDFAQYIGTRDRNTFTDPSDQAGRWHIPINYTLEYGHSYEFAFLRGCSANNGVSAVISEDGKGWLKNPSGAELDWYNTHKYDEYQYRQYKMAYDTSLPAPGTPFVATNDEGTFYPMRFSFRTPVSAPDLTAAAVTEIGDDFYIHFTDKPQWRATITDIMVDNVAINSAKYTIDPGLITLNNSLFKTDINHTITICFDGLDSSISSRFAFKAPFVAVGNGWNNSIGADTSVTVPPVIIPPVIVPPIDNLAEKINDISGHWAQGAITEMVNQKLIVGISKNNFAPDMAMTRGMFIAVLYRLAGNPISGNGNLFSDVSAADWYATAINWAYNTGIAHGVNAADFAPNAAITREQMALFLYNYANVFGYTSSAAPKNNLKDFSDYGTISAWSLPAISFCYDNELLVGKDGLRMAPHDTVTRAEATVLLQRFINTMHK